MSFSCPIARSSASFALSATLAVGVLASCAAQASAAKIKVSAVIAKSASGSAIQVTLSSGATPSARKKPKSVKVKAAGKTDKLSRAGASAAAAYSSSWKSKTFSGAYADKLDALNGKRLKVTVRSRTGGTTSHPKAIVQSSAGGGGGGGGPLFASPGQDLVGNDAFNFFSKYFLNSAFSDCAAGPWPYCTVEHRYVHCPSGAWEYHRNTPTSGSDIHSYYQFQVDGANAYVDGSWAVSYNVNSTSSPPYPHYIWQVTNTGVATGQYQFGSTVENLGPMYWSQPAITWQEPLGAC